MVKNIPANKTNWRYIAPKDNESKEKKVDGEMTKWCQKCRKGKGMWTKGRTLHSTEEHDPSKSTRRSNNDDSNNNDQNENNDSNEGLLAQTEFDTFDFGFNAVFEEELVCQPCIPALQNQKDSQVKDYCGRY